MNRVVFWLAVLGLAFLVWRFVQLAQRKQQRWRDQRNQVPPADRSAEKTDNQASDKPVDSGARNPASLARGEVMVNCARCGIYLPQSEALTRAGQSFCSAEHRDAKVRT